MTDQSSLRSCQLSKPDRGSYGFHVSRTQWDPYPWVSEVEAGSLAEFAGLQVGDCVLEVNGEDVLGQRIGEVARKAYARNDVKLLVWNAGADSNDALWMTGNGPTPLSLQRLATCLQSVLQLLECPVCLEITPPPVFQCCNGHVLCGDCRTQADKCPVCRVPMGTRGRCLLADKLHSLLISTFFQNKNKTKSKIRSKPPTRAHLQIRSRLKKTREATDVCCDKPAVRYHCPSEGCLVPVTGSDLLNHLQSHDGPLVRYHCRDTSATLRLPLSNLTAISLPRGELFFLHAQVHSEVGCLLLWLWLPQEDAHRYKFNLKFPNKKPLSGSVFPLSMTAAEIVDSSADSCVVLDDSNYDVICDTFSLNIIETIS